MKLTGNNRLKDLSDEAVIARFIESGNPAVLGILYNRYARLVFGLFLKYLKDFNTAEDETMAIFERLISDIRKYQIECFRAWLHTYCNNHCLMILRKKKPYFVDLIAETIASETYTSESDPQHTTETLIHTLNHLLSKLKPEQQKCIRLFYLEHLSYNDVSSHTGYSLSEVKSHIQNGKRNLRISLYKVTENNNEK